MTEAGTLVRPQPVGIYPIPVGLLVLPFAGGGDAAWRRQCLQGMVAADVPKLWAFYRLATAGDTGAALLALASDATSEGAYNRFVLQPSANALPGLRATLTGELLALLEVAAYSVGLTDDLPQTAGMDGELLATVLMAQAAAALEREASDEAIALLQKAEAEVRGPSPLFAAQLLGQIASVYRTMPEPLPLKAPEIYREALALLVAAEMPEIRCDLWMQLGTTCQEVARGREHLLNEAVRAYQEVLRSGLVPEEHRELFALAHNNLGLTFLSMPMSEDAKKLRLGIAVQSFREGLKLADREKHAALWGSIQLNLANALQYLPSSHQEENLKQAVDLYEELIGVGRKAYDPVGYAKILSNQANALAHLGIFSPALEKLQEARKLFEWHGESDLAVSALDMVGEIHEQMSSVAGRA